MQEIFFLFPARKDYRWGEGITNKGVLFVEKKKSGFIQGKSKGGAEMGGEGGGNK